MTLPRGRTFQVFGRHDFRMKEHDQLRALSAFADLPQNPPKIEASATIATSAIIGPAIAAMNMSP